MSHKEARDVVLEHMSYKVRNSTSHGGYYNFKVTMYDLVWDRVDSDVLPGNIIVAFLYTYGNKESGRRLTALDLFILDKKEHKPEMVGYGRWRDIEGYMEINSHFRVIRDEAIEVRPDWCPKD